jgi:hydroxymethylpyrimidine pyrophosphatase-like HAD family hydrolase
MIIATDLDGTIISTKNVNPETDTCVETYKNKPLSYMTPRATRLVKELSKQHIIIPTTTRSARQYNRLRIPWETPEWVIVANGGQILHNGIPDNEWNNHVTELLQQSPSDLLNVQKYAVNAFAQHSAFVYNMRVVDPWFFYLVGNVHDVHPEKWTQIRDHVHLLGWQLSIQRRKAYFVPTCVDKADATRYVLNKYYGTHHYLAAGDSRLDTTLISAATRAIAPLTEPAPPGLPPSVTVIPQRGVTSGEAVLKWFTDNAVESAAIQQ